MKHTYVRAGNDFSRVVTPHQSIALGALGSNLGNMLFQYSVWRLIRNKDESPVATGHDLYEQQAKRINADGKMLILPLANSFRVEFKERLERYTKLIKKLKVPVLVVGVGCQTDINFNIDNLKPIDKVVKDFVSAVLERSATIGVRGECTYNYLRKLGFTQIEIIGCPSMYFYGSYLPDMKPLPSFKKDTRIAVNVSSEISQCDFSSGLDWVGKFINGICNKYPETIYIPQEQRSLESIIYGGLGKGSEHHVISNDIFDFLIKNRRVLTFKEPVGWINYLRDMDFCIGSRIHGNIAGVLAGVPSTVIAHDSRTLELSQHHGLPYIMADSMLGGSGIPEVCIGKDFEKTSRIHKKNYENYCGFLKRNGVVVNDIELNKSDPFDRDIASSPLFWGDNYLACSIKSHLLMKAKRYKIRNLRKYGYFNV
ncbi:MAG: polysaccharide pyruvyl transferase family protein [Vreelandella alkaliphila]|uniref:polysaccharide pyruvyl transferase family protein n=1 Tax=Vreelandella alkaliphila TaxID=272774 RepID=UPI003F9B1837